jgi:hypothetical protein
MLDKLAKRGLSLSILVGTLLVPLTALAAIWLTDPDRGEEPSVPTPNVIPATTLTTQSTSEATIDITADLQAACGPEGMQLVSLEESLTITDVQQAALDALRGVCEQQGIPLPSKPVPEPIVQTVVVPAPATAGPVPSSTPTTFHDEDEDEDEYEDEYEDDYEDDYEDEHEDDD